MQFVGNLDSQLLNTKGLSNCLNKMIFENDGLDLIIIEYPISQFYNYSLKFRNLIKNNFKIIAIVSTIVDISIFVDGKCHGCHVRLNFTIGGVVGGC